MIDLISIFLTFPAPAKFVGASVASAPENGLNGAKRRTE